MTVITRSRWASFSAALLVAIAPLGAMADEEAVIKYRQAVMKATGGHMAASAALVRGKVSFDGDLARHAQAIVADMDMVPHLFPEGSDFGETDALEAIWEQTDDFEQATQDAQAAAKAFSDAAAGGDAGAIGKAFKALGKSCKGCHKDFRADDE